VSSNSSPSSQSINPLLARCSTNGFKEFESSSVSSSISALNSSSSSSSSSVEGSLVFAFLAAISSASFFAASNASITLASSVEVSSFTSSFFLDSFFTFSGAAKASSFSKLNPSNGFSSCTSVVYLFICFPSLVYNIRLIN